MNKYIAILFWIVGIALLVMMAFTNIFEIRIPPLFYLYFAVLVTWGSIVELYYSLRTSENINKRLYYFLWVAVVFFPAAITFIFSYGDSELINKQIELWTVCGLIFFFLQLSSNFLEKKAFKKE